MLSKVFALEIATYAQPGGSVRVSKKRVTWGMV